MRSVLLSLSKLGLTLCLLGLLLTGLLLTMTGCSGCGSQPKQEVQTYTPPPPAPISNEPQSLTLADLRSGVDYQLSGTGDNQRMQLRLMNRTNRTWEVEVEVGTKVEPSEGSVQSMVVTHEIKVTVQPHDEPVMDVQVACLDISKDPPASSNNSWSASPSPRLARFIACANGAADDINTEDSESASDHEKLRRGILQHSLWKARGASNEDFMHFFMNYPLNGHYMTEDEARQAVEESEPLLDRVVNKCPSVR
jgi:hypothetical protein